MFNIHFHYLSFCAINLETIYDVLNKELNYEALQQINAKKKKG
jgi:hypothetical protein